MIYSFRRSAKPFKKYDAVFSDGRVISFGDVRYQHFKDRTGLNLYSYLDHGDSRRRASFLTRTKKNASILYSPAWFSATFLW